MQKYRVIILLAASIILSKFLGITVAHAFPDNNPCAQINHLDMSDPVAEYDDCDVVLGITALEIRAAEVQMQRNPTPNVDQVPYQEDIVWNRAYRRMVGQVTLYDAPNGNPIGEIDAGYNYVTIINSQDGFTQIRYGIWVKDEHITWADVSQFSGVEITEQLSQPFAWMLAEARPSRFPGGPPNPDYDVIERYTIMNIYGVEYVGGWEWYLIGPNQWIQQIRVARVRPTQRPADIGENDRWLAVDLYEQTLVAYEGDRMVFTTLISSGLPQWSTREGLFRIYDRFEAIRMSGATGQPDFYFIDDVPWVMYFDGDIGLHGTYWHDRFGYRQSHGCVNMSIMDAWWVFQWTSEEQYQDAWVYVYSSGEYRSDLPSWARR